MRLLPACLLLLLVCNPALATETHSTSVTHASGRYTVHFDVLINADTNVVRHLMMDIHSWPRWSELVTGVKVLERQASNRFLVAVDFYSCAFVFCRSLKRIETVTIDEAGNIIAEATPRTGGSTEDDEPANHDFRYAREHWQVSPEGAKTRVRYDAVLEPDFFIPPLIGPAIMKSTIRRELLDSVRSLEHLAGSAADTSPNEQSE